MKINGFHDTTHTPFPMNNYSKYDNKFPLTSSPAIQIHFNGSDHWVTSAKYNGNVYFLDSIFMPITGNINTNLELQLVAMYGSPGREMEVTIPRLQQQNNCNDCGLFAIANAVEISYNQYPWERRVLFMKDKMRGHLIKCFEEEKFTRFPSKANNYKSIKKRYISTTCSCGMPDSMESLVGCKLCKLLWHKSCIASKENIPNVCHQCLKVLEN